MPPSGGYRTSLSWRARYGALGQSVTDAVFSPGQPLTPPDQEPVRVWDFPVGANTVITPRAGEPFGFAHLRAFANVELVRLAIETRKDQLEGLHWRFNPRDCGALQQKSADLEARTSRLTEFWRRPDRAHPFHTWLRLALEDLLAIDAPAFEKRRDRAGRLIGLDVVPGDTIKLLVDETGRTPAPPSPAYQQIIKGRVWADLSTQDLLYAPRNRRPGHLLGFSPVEQIVITIQTVINRQAAQLAYFTEGNAPLGFLTAPEGWGPSQIRELQLWLNTQLSGQQAERAKLIWTPAGAAYQALKDPPLKDDFDEWLARIVAFAFSLPPTPYVRQMNRATAGEDQDRSLEEGLGPLKLWGGGVRRPFGRTEPFDGDFDAIICAILAGLGSADWDGVEDRWTLHRYAALMRHWNREGPPAYIAAAAYLGLRGRRDDAPTLEGEDLVSFLSAFPGGA